ncbi:hypothetical protein [Brucella sp. BZ]|uniref:hypothetical protein n=1 Tax=Brucella sp. BZ TaxID=3381346 RepID=UPI0039E759BB
MTSININRLDGLNSATAWKGPVRVATTANIQLSDLQIIDGVALNDGDRVLVKDQTDARYNGIWVADTGLWRRARDFASNRDVREGTQVFVVEGATYNRSGWYVSSDDPIRFGTTDIHFTQNMLINSEQLEELVEQAQEAADEAEQARIAAELAAAAAEAAAGNNWSSFSTVASVQSTVIPFPISYLRTAGYYAAGDGGGALYKRVISEPTHAGKIQSADGAWWELSTEYVTPNMFGARCDGVNDDVPAINAAWAYATSLGLIGAPLHLVSNKVYYAGTSIQLGPIDSKQRVLEGNGALIKCLPTFTGYLFDSNNLAGVFAWRVELRNFTADGIYMSSDVNFVRLRHVNGINLDNVYVQSFNIAMNLNDSYAVATRGVTFRYIRQHVFLLNTSSMQLKLIDTRAYGTNSGSGVTGAAAIRNVAANNNITLIGCDFESGKGPFFYTNAVVNQLSITNSYIEGFEVDPIYFDAAVNAFTFEGNWLGYNNGRQEWANIKSGRISGNVFAKQAFFVGAGNGDVFEGNNVFIDQTTITPAEQKFSFRVIAATMASGATALDTPGYKRTPTGEVQLSGRLSRAASGDLFTLPDGYRPKVATTFLTVVEGTFNRARVDITTAGVVSVTYEATAGAIRLDGYGFLS